LYPDTYKLNGDKITPESVVEQMLNRLSGGCINKVRTKLSWICASSDTASIVEKEAVVHSERSRIAGVFSHAERGGILGADPTVEYGLGIRQTVDQPLTLAEVNTPPILTLITAYPDRQPGLASLKAAPHPENTSYLYFVARYVF